MGYFTELREKHYGESIAVIGSGPTAALFNSKEDVSLVVNGAANLFNADYFVCADRTSPALDWFYASKDSIRVLASYLTPFDKLAHPDVQIRNKLQSELGDVLDIKYKNEKEFLEKLFEPINYISDVFIPSITPATPHVFYQNEKLNGIINKEQDALFHGASISGIALQLAFIMGAKEIHLYGCSFDNDSGVNYAYTLGKNDFGATKPTHISRMDEIIDCIMKENIDIFVHGYSRLTKGIKVN